MAREGPEGVAQVLGLESLWKGRGKGQYDTQLQNLGDLRRIELRRLSVYDTHVWFTRLHSILSTLSHVV